MGFSSSKLNTKKIAETLGIAESVLIDAIKANSYGGFARVWTIEDKGNYSTAKISVSKKDKNTDNYTTDFMDGYVRLVGEAHNALKGIYIDEKKGIGVKISSCEVTNVYTAPNGAVSYKPHYTIFGLEVLDGNSRQNTKANANSAKKSGSDDFMSVPDGIDEELPFN